MLKLTNINIRLDEKSIHKDLSLTFEKGLNYAILGPSGIGKSTLLNLIAGLLNDYTGIIENSFKNISYSFQEGRLIPWLTVEENLKYVSGNDSTFDYLLNLFQVNDLKNSLVKTLSGGEKQRVSLARALSTKPDLLLLDESFNSLSLKMKYEIFNEMTIHLKKSLTTLIYVSHNIEEALLLGDKIVIFNKMGNVDTVIDVCINISERQSALEKLAIYEKQILDIIMK